jgi:Kef-type K+ transport system membrane component KefB
MEGLFREFARLLIVSALAGAIAIRLKQPLLVAYILVGLLAGPGLGWVHSQDQIALLAQLGVTVLLFVVGLKLDLSHIRHIGRVALATGLGQLTITTAAGFLIAFGLGKGRVEAIYLAVALTFSSTIIIVKLLSDKRELDTLHGRIAVGFLIVQDIAVIVAMVAITALGGVSEIRTWEIMASFLLRLVLAFLLIFLMMRYILPRLLDHLARSLELLLIFAIAWAAALAAAGEWLGFSREAGAFLAGFMLASTGYREMISARLTGIRDFLLLFFFIDLGTNLDVFNLGQELVLAVVLSLFVLIGNPLIVMAIMGYMGYRKRTGFMAGLTVAQISEFSIVFIAMGISVGHIGIEALGLTTLVGLITITLSTYMILYSQPIYERLVPLLSVFERKMPFRELAFERGRYDPERPEVVIFGLGRYGSRLAQQLTSEVGLHVLGVDFDPEVARAFHRQPFDVRFGDAEDPNFLESLPLDGAFWIVSTLPQLEASRYVLHALEQRGYTGQTAVVIREEANARLLQDEKITKKLFPFNDAADYAARIFREDILTRKGRI